VLISRGKTGASRATITAISAIDNLKYNVNLMN
jgi:hypothetical protein